MYQGGLDVKGETEKWSELDCDHWSGADATVI